MKIVIVTLISFFTVSMGLSQSCDDSYVNSCANGKEYIYLKSRTFDVTNPSAERMKFLLNLKRNSQYMFSICDESVKGKDLLVKLYNYNGDLLVSNFNKKEQKYHNKIQFNCNKSGKYIIKAYIKGESTGSGCGAILLEMKKSVG